LRAYNRFIAWLSNVTEHLLFACAALAYEALNVLPDFFCFSGVVHTSSPSGLARVLRLDAMHYLPLPFDSSQTVAVNTCCEYRRLIGVISHPSIGECRPAIEQKFGVEASVEVPKPMLLVSSRLVSYSPQGT
jgi:hypothetical protein